MIYVTHDQVEAMTLGDRIAVMNDGIIQQLAEPLQLYDRPINQFVAGFLGTPPMNFMSGRVEEDAGKILFNEGSAKIELPGRLRQAMGAVSGREAVFGVRPEDISISDGSAVIRAKVNVLEPLGDEMIVYLSTDYHDLICKAPSHQQVAVDDLVGLNFNIDKAHLFDPESGKNVSLTQPGQSQA